MNTLKMRSFQTVRPGETAVLALPIAHTYHDLINVMGGDLTLEDIGEIRIVANGETIDSWKSGQQLVDFNEYKGLVLEDDSLLHISFERPNLLNREHREISAIGTGVLGDPDFISTLAIEIDILDTCEAPTLRAYANVSPSRPSGIIRQTRHFVYEIAAAGEFEITTLPRGLILDKAFFKAIDTADDDAPVEIEEMELQVNEEIKWQRTKAINEHMQKNGIRVVPDDFEYMVFDPSENGYGSEGLDTSAIREMMFKLKVPQACRLIASVEYFGRLPQKSAV